MSRPMSIRVYAQAFACAILFVAKLSHAQSVLPDNPGTSTSFLYTFIGGVEQVGLSSKPSSTEPFVRLFGQSGEFKGKLRMWGNIRLLGAPDQSDTNGIYSVFADPTGQITTQKLSSVGTAADFSFGPSYRLFNWTDTGNSVDLFVGFGATTPLQSDQVAQAFATPVYGTAECNILYQKYLADFANPSFAVQIAPSGVATGSTNACLINRNAATTSNGTTTYAPITTLAFSSQDRTSFFLKDMIGIRFNHTVRTVPGQTCGNSAGQTACYLGTLDMGVGHDSSITGGVLRGNRPVFRVDAVYPIIPNSTTSFYVFGSFATRFEKNKTDNTPLILQPASLSGLSGSGTTAVPNINTIVLPLREPDRDFWRIGVGIDILSLFKTKS